MEKVILKYGPGLQKGKWCVVEMPLQTSVRKENLRGSGYVWKYRRSIVIFVSAWTITSWSKYSTECFDYRQGICHSELCIPRSFHFIFCNPLQA